MYSPALTSLTIFTFLFFCRKIFSVPLPNFLFTGFFGGFFESLQPLLTKIAGGGGPERPLVHLATIDGAGGGGRLVFFGVDVVNDSMENELDREEDELHEELDDDVDVDSDDDDVAQTVVGRA